MLPHLHVTTLISLALALALTPGPAAALVASPDAPIKPPALVPSPVSVPSPSRAPAPALLLKSRATGMDLTDACHRQWGGDWHAVNNGDKCEDWKCVSPDGRAQTGVNMALHCFQSKGVDSYASCGSNAWDWSCS